MRPSVRTARLARPLAALALAACDEDLALGDVQGTYVLERPAEGLADGYSDTLFVVVGPAGDGGARFPALRKVTSRERRAGAPAGSAPDSQVVWTTHYGVRVRHDDAYLTPACDPAAPTLCVAWLYRGPLEGDRLTLRPRPEMSVPALRYRRVHR